MVGRVFDLSNVFAQTISDATRRVSHWRRDHTHTHTETVDQSAVKTVQMVAVSSEGREEEERFEDDND